jgi:hypothetical protein
MSDCRKSIANVMNEPVLVIAFNRPDLLEQLLQRLREIRPSHLYVAVDGPRPDRPGESEKVEACRNLVASVDWPCEVHRLFHDRNHGCGLGVSTAISWFFQHVDRGIILEDDIIPDPSFFGFCAELLDRYEHDERVFAITGCNFVPPSAQSHPADAYRFSRVAHIWGWATWRRSWHTYRLDIQGWRKQLPMARLWRSSGRSVSGSLFWAMTFELMARKQVDTWDAQLVYAAMRQDQLIATCNTNLVRNIGFGDDATHTLEVVDIEPVGSVVLPTKPVRVQADERADAWTRLHHFQVTLPGIAHQAFNYAARKFRRTA